MEATPGGTAVLSLPTELLISIFRKAKLRTLLRCAQVCRRWHTLIRDTPELQFQVELESHEVQDNCPVGLNLVERLQLLKRRQAAWRAGTRDEMLPVRKLPRSPPTTWAYNGNSLAYVDRAARMVHYKQLGQSILSAEDSAWSLPDGGTSLALSLDPDQDLLALASLHAVMDFHVSILLRSLRTGAVHPLSLTSGELRREVSVTHRSATITQQGFCIFGDLISVSVIDLAGGISDTSVWNWKTGVLGKRISGPRTNMILVNDSLGMLWNPKILTDDGLAGGLSVHIVQENASGLWSLSDNDYDYALLMPSSLLGFPNFGRHEVRLYSPRQTHSQSSVFPPAPGADHLITLDMFEFNQLVGMRTRRLLISHAKLLAKLPARPHGGPGHVVPWDEWKACIVWASEQTRRDAFEPQMTTGMRYVEQAPPSADNFSSSFDIMDFEPRRVARAMSTGLYPGESLVHDSRFVNGELVVQHPFLIRRVKVTHDIRSWLSAHLITDEGFFVVSPDIPLSTGIKNGVTTVSMVPFAENIGIASSQ